MIVAPFILAAIISQGSATSVPVALVPDTPMKVGNIEAVCTGVGLGARENSAWTSYPLKVEVAGRGGQYLGDIRVTVSQQGNSIAVVSCDGPWVLFQLPAGKYRVDAEAEGITASSSASVPLMGQARVVLRYPTLGGSTGAPLMTSLAAPSLSQ